MLFWRWAETSDWDHKTITSNLLYMEKRVSETWPAEIELWTLQLCCFWSDHLGRTDTCSFLVFFLGIGSLPLSDSDLLLTDRRCSFLSWEPENTEKYWAASLTDFTRQIFIKTKHPQVCVLPTLWTTVVWSGRGGLLHSSILAPAACGGASPLLSFPFPFPFPIPIPIPIPLLLPFIPIFLFLLRTRLRFSSAVLC